MFIRKVMFFGLAKAKRGCEMRISMLMRMLGLMILRVHLHITSTWVQDEISFDSELGYQARLLGSGRAWDVQEAEVPFGQGPFKVFGGCTTLTDSGNTLLGLNVYGLRLGGLEVGNLKLEFHARS